MHYAQRETMPFQVNHGREITSKMDANYKGDSHTHKSVRIFGFTTWIIKMHHLHKLRRACSMWSKRCTVSARAVVNTFTLIYSVHADTWVRNWVNIIIFIIIATPYASHRNKIEFATSNHLRVLLNGNICQVLMRLNIQVHATITIFYLGGSAVM